MARWLIVAASLVLGTACAPEPWLPAARSGTLAELQRYVEVAAERQQFDRGRVAELAEAVAAREIEVADDPSVFERIASLGPCASEVYYSLERRAKRLDEGAAAAAMLLFESGFSGGLRVVTPQKETGAWRAYTVRLASLPERHSEVYAALLDVDARVRSAAMRTIARSPAAIDAPQLINVIRFDPEVALKQAALSVLGERGDVKSLLTARDYWDEMAEPTRLALVQALNEPLARRHGSEMLLVRIMESNDSIESVAAASLLFHGGTASRGYAMSRLLRSLHEGPASERLLALATLPPSDAEVRFDVQKLAVSSLPFLRVAALEIYLRLNVSSARARQRLAIIQGSKDADADAAARILARYGDPVAIARMERLLGSSVSGERLAAARILLDRGQWGSVARALTDDHPAVRLALSCDVLRR